jgi:hypothetical protein
MTIRVALVTEGMLNDAVKKARREELEWCAKVADRQGHNYPHTIHASEYAPTAQIVSERIATAIRARKDEK